MPDPIILKSKTITGTSDGPHLLITAGVHGDEFEPMAAVRALIPRLRPEGLRGRVTLAPVVNEAAFANKARWAEDGLDMARTCPGRPDGSITERTAHAVTELILTSDLYIDLHTGGTIMMVLPFTGYPMGVSEKTLEANRRMARAFNLPICWSNESKGMGRTLSITRDNDIPSIYAEHMGGARCEEQGVKDYIEGCLNVMGEFDMIDHPRPASRVEHFVEDERENSTHMQLQNPSPIEGFFAPAVALGQRVEPGDLIGTVSDCLGEQEEKVHSTQSGIILTLRTFNRVDKDDALAVICEVDRPYGGGA